VIADARGGTKDAGPPDMTATTRVQLAFALALGIAATAPGCIVIDGDSSLTIANRSSRVLDEVHLAEPGDPDWGRDLLPGALLPGQDLVILGIDCDYYDVLVVDEDGAACVLPALHLCFDDHRWTITDETLAACARPEGMP
jgi:hypothetical protein